MSSIHSRSSLHLFAIGIALALLAGSAFADKPSWAGEGRHKEGKSHREEKDRSDQGRDDDRHGDSLVLSFGSEDRRIVSEYYGTQMRKGNCPPAWQKRTTAAKHQDKRKNGKGVNRWPRTFSTTSCLWNCVCACQHRHPITAMSRLLATF